MGIITGYDVWRTAPAPELTPEELKERWEELVDFAFDTLNSIPREFSYSEFMVAIASEIKRRQAYDL